MKRYHKKLGGILMIDVDGGCRYLTFWETIKYYLGVK